MAPEEDGNGGEEHQEDEGGKVEAETVAANPIEQSQLVAVLVAKEACRGTAGAADAARYGAPMVYPVRWAFFSKNNCNFVVISHGEKVEEQRAKILNFEFLSTIAHSSASQVPNRKKGKNQDKRKIGTTTEKRKYNNRIGHTHSFQISPQQ